MQTKTVVKVISLYDYITQYIENNILILLITFHHIIIIAFNYYYISTLKYEEYEEDYRIIIEEYQVNLEYCQVVTLFTFISLFTVVNGNKDIIQINQLRFAIMMISFILKFTYSLYQYKHYYKQYYELQQSIYFKEPYIKTLVASYELRIVMLITFVLCICLVPWVVIFVSYVVEFAKNYKITLVEKIKTNIVKP